MAWFDWLTPNKSVAAAQHADSSGLLNTRQMDDMRSQSMAKKPMLAQPAAVLSAQRLEQRRNERNAKRELLFQVVRESMVRVGVLSSAFKFKVLSLDQRGRSFLVMLELSAQFSDEASKLAEIETLIAQTAKHRYDITVQAVYWRYITDPQPSATHATGAASAPAPLLGAMHAPISRPAPLFAMNGSSADRAAASFKPVARVPMPAQAPDPFSVTRSIPVIGATTHQISASRASVQTARDDVGDDEVAAFRRALAAAAAHGAIAAKSAHTAPAPAATRTAAATVAAAASASALEQARTKLLLTGYEETEMADDEPMPALSGTQYGDLR